MKSVSLFLILTFGLAARSLLAQETIRIRDQNIPGKLESFLLATPNASLSEKVLVILKSSSANATFTAMVATNPDTKTVEKGLEVRLEQGDLKTVAYLDDDCLKRLEKSLQSLLKTQEFIDGHRKDYSRQDLEVPHVTLAYNQVPGSDEHADKAGVMAVGFYGHEEGFGLYLGIHWGTLHLSGQFYFPNASLSDLLKTIQSANTFLVAN